jgi:hypothetical protein
MSAFLSFLYSAIGKNNYLILLCFWVKKVSPKNLGFNAITFFEKMKIYFCRKINNLSKIDNRRLGVAKKPRFFVYLLYSKKPRISASL